MFSVAVSLFNVEKMQYDWEAALSNFLNFGDELVINVNESGDKTDSLILNWKAAQSRKDAIKIVLSDFSYNDPELDGKCKNNAVQNCEEQFIILVDIDESLILSQRPQWERLALEYIQKDRCDCILIPSLNLWGNEKIAKDINQKWYIQRQGIRRGVVNFARNKDGTHDTDRSDGCEPLVDKEGNLARSLALIPPDVSNYEKLMLIKQNELPYVVHHGYEDLDKRIHRNKEFWASHWKIEAGNETLKIPTTIEELGTPQTFEHGLKIRDEVKMIENE